MPIYEYRCGAGHMSEQVVVRARDRATSVACTTCGAPAPYVPSRFSGYINDYDHRAVITETADMFVGTPLADGMEPCREFKQSYNKKPFIELSELTS